MSPPQEGDVHVVERTFTTADVEEFAAVSRDTQAIHTERDPPMVHGLLTATLSTEVGGDLAVLARTMTFDFLAPVYAGDTVRCEWTTERVDAHPDRYDLTASVECRRTASRRADAEQTVVLRGEVTGLVWRSDRDGSD
jgi:acyl dehydratase